MFETVGAKSRRLMLIDLVAGTEPGTLIRYEELGDLFGLGSRMDIQGAVNGAKRSVEANTKKSLVAVKNEGYRVALPDEHHSLAVKHQRKGRNQIKRAMSKVQNVNLAALTQDQRTVLIAAQVALAAQADFERRADIRYAKRAEMEAFMSEQSTVNHRSDERLREMQERMERLEKKLTKEA